MPAVSNTLVCILPFIIIRYHRLLGLCRSKSAAKQGSFSLVSFFFLRWDRPSFPSKLDWHDLTCLNWRFLHPSIFFMHTFSRMPNDITSISQLPLCLVCLAVFPSWMSSDSDCWITTLRRIIIERNLRMFSRCRQHEILGGWALKMCITSYALLNLRSCVFPIFSWIYIIQIRWRGRKLGCFFFIAFLPRYFYSLPKHRRGSKSLTPDCMVLVHTHWQVRIGTTLTCIDLQEQQDSPPGFWYYATIKSAWWDCAFCESSRLAEECVVFLTAVTLYFV